MRRKFLSVFVIILGLVTAGSLWAAESDETSFNLIFEKKPAVIIDFVDTSNRTISIDSINFPMVSPGEASGGSVTVTANATIRFQVHYEAELYLVCTRLQDLSGYIASREEGASQQNAAMLLSDTGNRLNYKVEPVKWWYWNTNATSTGEGQLTEFTPQENWEIDPSTWSVGTQMSADDADWHTARVNTEYRTAKVYTSNPAYLSGGQLVYDNAYTRDVFIDLQFTLTFPESTSITDGIYTGYCHLVLEAT